jgi:hypothetical protein
LIARERITEDKRDIQFVSEHSGPGKNIGFVKISGKGEVSNFGGNNTAG